MEYEVCGQCQFPEFDDAHTGADGVCEIYREKEVECFACSKVKENFTGAFTYNGKSICWECYSMKGGCRTEEWCESIEDARAMCLKCLQDMKVYEIFPRAPVNCSKCSSGIFADRWEVNLSHNGPCPEYFCRSCCDPQVDLPMTDYMCKGHKDKFTVLR